MVQILRLAKWSQLCSTTKVVQPTRKNGMSTNKNGNVYPTRMGVDKQQKLGLTMKTQDRSMENQENRVGQNKKSNAILYNLQTKKPRLLNGYHHWLEHFSMVFSKWQVWKTLDLQNTSIEDILLALLLHCKETLTAGTGSSAELRNRLWTRKRPEDRTGIWKILICWRWPGSPIVGWSQELGRLLTLLEVDVPSSYSQYVICKITSFNT